MEIIYIKVSETEPKYKKIVEVELTTEELTNEKEGYESNNQALENSKINADGQISDNNSLITKIDDAILTTV